MPKTRSFVYFLLKISHSICIEILVKILQGFVATPGQRSILAFGTKNDFSVLLTGSEQPRVKNTLFREHISKHHLFIIALKLPTTENEPANDLTFIFNSK